MALISGKEVKKGPKQEPANPKLWNMLTTQARSKFAKYPSPAASHWVHSRYVQLGGKFVPSKKDIDPRFRDYVQEEKDRKKAEARKKVTKDIGRNLIRGESRR
jgi:hypothetical protein